MRRGLILWFTSNRMYGEVALCRKVLLLGVNSASDDPETMCQELLQFEREEGNNEDEYHVIVH